MYRSDDDVVGLFGTAERDGGVGLLLLDVVGPGYPFPVSPV